MQKLRNAVLTKMDRVNDLFAQNRFFGRHPLNFWAIFSKKVSKCLGAQAASMELFLSVIWNIDIYFTLYSPPLLTYWVQYDWELAWNWPKSSIFWVDPFNKYCNK